MRLQKFLARAGVASRRAAETYITAGRVTVNGALVTELGSKVNPDVDEVAVDGQPVCLPQACVVVMLNKPAGYVTTMSDPQGRPTVAGLIPKDEYPALYPVGRLDTDTTGLLLFTDDGELGNRLIHPRHHVFKRYVATVEGVPTDDDLALLAAGIELEDGLTLPAHVERLSTAHTARKSQKNVKNRRSDPPLTSRIVLEIQEGRKRQVRRMFDAIGHPVIALHRESLGPLTLGDLPEGSWRLLTDDEVELLRTISAD